MQTKQVRFNMRVGSGVLIGLVILLAFGAINSPVARADGGGFPTRTPTVTLTSTPSLTPVNSPTATFTSLPPYPIVTAGAEQSAQQEVAGSEIIQSDAQSTENGSFLGGCFQIGMLLLLAAILIVTFFFVRRTRKKPE
jgi:hypothetical protein